uniref:Uncharacterized protein n=1 Tax=Nelumbo nucifera TaxID=4432 RepID=A0A822XTG1_NELNU|nr:TPA_asm: hypothetical protein HUJ06_023568 [Nelumbo nucifera]
MTASRTGLRSATASNLPKAGQGVKWTWVLALQITTRSGGESGILSQSLVKSFSPVEMQGLLACCHLSTSLELELHW